MAYNEAFRSKLLGAGMENLVKEAYEAGFRYERDYHGCAQACVGALQEVLGIQDEGVFKAAGGLGGGIGLSCSGACGGLTGGIMIISYLYGRSTDDLEDKLGKRMVAYRLASRLLEKYLDKYGTITCKDIQKQLFGRFFDLRRPDDFEALVAAGGHSHICPEVVGSAAAMTVRVISEHETESQGEAG